MTATAAGTLALLAGSYLSAAQAQAAPQMCLNHIVTIVATGPVTQGTTGNDVIMGTDAPDEIHGGPGNDIICGNGGDDVLYGDDGNDTIDAGAGDDYAQGSADQDDLRGGDGNDELRGGASNDMVDGGAGNDLVDGGVNNDTVKGGPGDDVVLGSAGNDNLWGGDGADTLEGGDGNDDIRGEAGPDTLRGGNENDVLYGGADVDACDGGAGSNELHECETTAPTAPASPAPSPTPSPTPSPMPTMSPSPTMTPTPTTPTTPASTYRCTGCGATAAGTGLRNRAHGAVHITGVPAGATVSKAVLVWAILDDGDAPPASLTFAGTKVTADITSTVSSDLCWGDSASVGYAADVTGLVPGNGTYDITDPPRGITRPKKSPRGLLPLTDGASLLVFYTGGGANKQVLADFSYDTNTADPNAEEDAAFEDDDSDDPEDADDPAASAIDRYFTGVNATGGGATLTLAGPDGQKRGDDVFGITGATTTTLYDTWDGSDPQDGPQFTNGNLWDTDVYDVSSVLPAGQTSLHFHAGLADDCIGVSAAVLQVGQNQAS